MGRAVSYTVLVSGLGFLALVMVMLSVVSLKAAVALAPAMLAGSLIVFHPMLGLFLLVVFAQLDAVASHLSGPLPVSFYKLLTAATIAGVALASFGKPRAERLGPASRTRAYAVLLLLWMALSTIWARNPGLAKDFLEGMSGSMLLLFLIVWLADTPGRLRLLVWTLVVTGLISAIVVIADTKLGIRLVSTDAAATSAQFDGVERSSGASNYNPTTASHMLLATTVISVLLFFGDTRLRWLSGASVILGLAALVFTLARSAIIALALAVVVFAWHHRGHRMFPFALVMAVAALAAVVPFLPDIFWERMATLFNAAVDRTLFRRVSYNLIGLDLIRQHPVLGVGPGNFPDYYVDIDYRWYPGREPEPRQLHNSYLEVAAESGLIALGLFLGAMLSALRAGLSAARAEKGEVQILAKATSYAFCAFLLASLFMPNEDIKFMWILPALCVAADEITRRIAASEGR